MKVIDISQNTAPKEGLNKILAEVQNAAGGLLGGSAEAQGQETLISYLSRVLNNRYTLLRNVKLEGVDINIPMILLGPTGINVITTRADKGIFQVKAESISKMSGSKELTPIRPSPVNRTMMMAQAVGRYLRDHNIEPPEVQPVMFFSNPGTHIDSTRPSVRLVQIDGLDRYASSLLHGQMVLAPEDVHSLVNIFNKTLEVESPAETDGEASQHPRKPGVLEPRLTNSLDRMGRKFSMKTSQWIFLGAIALIEVIILIVFIFIILTNV